MTDARFMRLCVKLEREVKRQKQLLGYVYDNKLSLMGQTAATLVYALAYFHHENINPPFVAVGNGRESSISIPTSEDKEKIMKYLYQVADELEKGIPNEEGIIPERGLT